MIVHCKECKNRYTEDCPMCYLEPDFDGTLYCLADNTADEGYCYLGEREKENDT